MTAAEAEQKLTGATKAVVEQLKDRVLVGFLSCSTTALVGPTKARSSAAQTGAARGQAGACPRRIRAASKQAQAGPSETGQTGTAPGQALAGAFPGQTGAAPSQAQSGTAPGQAQARLALRQAQAGSAPQQTETRPALGQAHVAAASGPPQAIAVPAQARAASGQAASPHLSPKKGVDKVRGVASPHARVGISCPASF